MEWQKGSPKSKEGKRHALFYKNKQREKKHFQDNKKCIISYKTMKRLSDNRLRYSKLWKVKLNSFNVLHEKMPTLQNKKYINTFKKIHLLLISLHFIFFLQIITYSLRRITFICDSRNYFIIGRKYSVTYL